MTTHVVEYNVSDAAIAELKKKYTGLTAETPQQYEEVRQAIAETRTLRVAVEKTRKELKKDALEYGRKVDAEAKRITRALMEVEEPLKLEKQKVDDEKERIRREKEEAERQEQERIRAEEEAERRAAEQAERDRIRKEQEAENARIQAEREKLAKEREKIDAERRAEQKKIEEERAALKAEQDRLDRERFEREAKERAEREAREKTEREAAQKAAAEKQAAERARLEAERLPDREKLIAFADAIESLEAPNMTSEWGRSLLKTSTEDLGAIAESIRIDVGEVEATPASRPESY